MQMLKLFKNTGSQSLHFQPSVECTFLTCMWTISRSTWVIQNGYKDFQWELLFYFRVHSYSILLVAAVKDKVVGVGVRCAMKNRNLGFLTNVQTPILEGTFSCKRLYILFCIFALFLYYRKVLCFETYFELHAVMWGDCIVQSIGESTKA